MAELDQLQQNMIQKMKEFEEMQKQMKELQEKQKKYEYKGAELKIKLEISDKTFITSTKVLCNKQHGNNLFIRQIIGNDVKNDNDEGDDNKSSGCVDVKVIEAQKKGTTIQLFFDRDPEIFPFILKYLRGYNMKSTLNNCSIQQFESLLDDANYYKIDSLINMVSNCLYNRFDPLFCAPSIILKNNHMSATRNVNPLNVHHSCGVYGILRSGKRYIEFEMLSQGSRYIMFGVTEGDSFSYTPYPGHAKCRGCSYYAVNGHCYRSNSSEQWGAAMSYGDRIGIFVEISNNQSSATITWYINGKIVKQSRNLKDYMDVNKGVVFVANMYSNSDQVVIVQNSTLPQ